MWHLAACKISASLLLLNWIKNKVIFYRISKLMLATLIQRYDKKSFHFKHERLTEILQVSGATLYKCTTMYQFIKAFLDNNILFFRNMEPLRSDHDRSLLYLRSVYCNYTKKWDTPAWENNENPDQTPPYAIYPATYTHEQVVKWGCSNSRTSTVWN